MTMKKRFLIFLFSVMLFQTGCIIAPMPTCWYPELSGQLTDALGKPLAGVEITFSCWGIKESTQKTTTAEDGSFTVGPARFWSYIIHIGSPCLYPNPPRPDSNALYMTFSTGDFHGVLLWHEYRDHPPLPPRIFELWTTRTMNGQKQIFEQDYRVEQIDHLTKSILIKSPDIHILLHPVER